MTLASPRPYVRLDVRPLLAEGIEPFDTIMQAVAAIELDGTLELTAPFEPVPLYPVLLERGFRHETEPRGPTEWVVRFRRTGITADDPLSAIAAHGPATRAVLDAHGVDLPGGGAKTLRYAAWAHRLDLHGLLRELQATVD
ncbi:MAG TPA: DUF2249 domain-containing protein [Gemmatimonadales bacterium]|nr:DUF2249 domain-containing protein [Gemmatimonadales bacterium]